MNTIIPVMSVYNPSIQLGAIFQMERLRQKERLRKEHNTENQL